MGIKLDWEIETDQSRVSSTGEDKDAARRRRVIRARLLAFVVFVLIVVGVIAAAVAYRLRQVDAQMRQVLTSTVDAEVTALRLGDRDSFLSMQRSATDEWQQKQNALFDSYQALKSSQDTQLTGQILDLAVDNTRARVKLQEIIGGVPYAREWFYWRYDDGWRHVPPDYTFWGDPATLEESGVTVHYRTVDDALAQAMGPQLAQWLKEGCAAVSCDSLPKIDVEILPDEALQIGWSTTNPWSMQVPSPLSTTARLDMPFDASLQTQIASLFAERLVQQTTAVQTVYPSDAVFLRQAAVDWLAAHFTGAQMNSYLVDSLVHNYGADAVGRLLRALQPASDIGVVNQVTAAPSLAQSNVDWRDFLSWRLNTEADLISKRDQTSFALLYDLNDDAARVAATRAYTANAAPVPQAATAVVSELGPNGEAQLRARVQIGTGDSAQQAEATWRMVDGSWKRVS